MNNSDKDHITVLHIFSGDLWAGAEVMIYNLLSKLKEESNLKIIALSLNEGILAGKLRDAGIETYVIPEAYNSFAQILLKAYNLLKKRKVDIIHSHRYKENILAFLLSRTTGAKRLITTMHGLSEPSLLTQNEKHKTRLTTRLNYFILINFFTHVVAVSQDIKKILIEKYKFKPEKLEVIYNGIPIPSTSISLDPSAHSSNGFFHIGTVGRMVPVKDFDLFLEVAAELKKVTERVRFSILGDGPLKAWLLKKAKELKIKDDVEFLTPRIDPYPYYHEIDLYLNTSLHEGIPLSMLEAMSCGKAVVAPKVGGIPEIISHGMEGYLIEERIPGMFSDLCNELIKDKWKMKKIGIMAKRKIMNLFSDTKMANRYHDLYLKINRISI